MLLHRFLSMVGVCIALLPSWVNGSTNYVLAVAAERPDAIYKQGEVVTFTVKLWLDNQPVDGATVNWIISKDGPQSL